MTPKEALEVLVSNFDQRVLKSLSGSDNYWTVYEEYSEALKTLEQSLNELEALKKTPTADEVCKALSDFTKRQVTYNNAKKDFIDEYGNSVEQFLFDAYHLKKIPSYIITLIGRFYEGVEVKE